LAILQAVTVLLVLRAWPVSMRIPPRASGFASCRLAPAVLETS
jgi:hypothetical protein